MKVLRKIKMIFAGKNVNQSQKYERNLMKNKNSKMENIILKILSM